MSTLAVHQVLNTTELLSMILESLRDRVQKDQGVACSTDESLLGDSQVKWKAVLKDAAFVNQPFFHATVDMIWEHMHSLEPFLSLLELPDTDTVPLAYSGSITKAAWRRFEFYSSKTKSLALGVPKASHLLNPCWAYYLTSSNGRRDTNFPALKTLSLKSTDNISMMITFSALPRIRLLHVDLGADSEKPEAKDALTALTAALAEAPGSISDLHFSQPVDTRCIQNLSRLRGLGRLHVVLSHGDVEALGPNFWSHKRLAFGEASRDVDFHDNTFLRLQNTTMLGGKLLALSGSSLQHTLADKYTRSMFPSHTLDAAFFNFVYTGSHLEDLPSPVTTGTYLSRNPGLQRFHLVSVTAKRIHPHALNRARTNPLFNDPRPFLTALANCHSLEALSITGLVVGSGDIALQIFGVLKHLPRLASLYFLPLGFSGGTEGLLLLSLAALADVPKYNPLLVAMSVTVDLPANPSDHTRLPMDHPSGHHLRELGLYPGVPCRFPRYSIKDYLALAMYLYRLFPNFEDSLKLPRAQDPDMHAFWEAIDEAMESFRQVQQMTTQRITDTL
ncbi:hypothetical protein NMY22_g14094 [Coprinellus aureogranulatus]|nr:hypothetical protein NMY22_g14094 [Coprinellus aureogranulatus]